MAAAAAVTAANQVATKSAQTSSQHARTRFCTTNPLDKYLLKRVRVSESELRQIAAGSWSAHLACGVRRKRPRMHCFGATHAHRRQIVPAAVASATAAAAEAFTERIYVQTTLASNFLRDNYR